MSCLTKVCNLVLCISGCGIVVVKELPRKGEFMQDHSMGQLQSALAQPSVHMVMKIAASLVVHVHVCDAE